jgi:hypothetical protein
VAVHAFRNSRFVWADVLQYDCHQTQRRRVAASLSIICLRSENSPRLVCRGRCLSSHSCGPLQQIADARNSITVDLCFLGDRQRNDGPALTAA